MAPVEPIQSFVDNYIKLTNDYDINTFHMLLEMKCISKRSDVNNYIEIFKTRIPPNTSSIISSSSANNNNNEHENETRNRLKQFDKLQDLIKKKNTFFFFLISLEFNKII
jgi:hypothetical protein